MTFNENPYLHLIAFLFPLSVYFLFLGAINRRHRPVMIPGSWDFAILLFAISGFLVVGGPSILLQFHNSSVMKFYQRGTNSPETGAGFYSFWMWMFVAYYLVVAIGSGVFLWLRRAVTVIYNADPLVVERTLGQILDRLGLQWMQLGQRFLISPARKNKS